MGLFHRGDKVERLEREIAWEEDLRSRLFYEWGEADWRQQPRLEAKIAKQDERIRVLKRKRDDLRRERYHSWKK